MKGKELRMRAARLLAVVYVMYVVLSGMAIPGADGSYKPLFKAKAASSVTVTNNDKLYSAKAGRVVTTNLSDKKITYFSFNKHANSPYIDSKYIYNVYSVKYDGKDYYYDPANNGDGTKPGLFYSDQEGKWGFVFPASAASYDIQVQIAVELSGKNVTIFNESFQASAAVGAYEQLSSGILGTMLDTQLVINYYNYEGDENTKRISCSSTGDFSSSNLRFYCLAKEANHYTYRIQYGGSCFPYQGDINNPATLQIWKTSSPTATANIQPGTNRLVVDTNIADAKKYIQMTKYVSIAGVPVSGVYATDLTYKNISKERDCEFPEEGIYIPLMKDPFGDEQYYLFARISVGDAQKGVDIPLAVYQSGYGPKASTLGNIEAGNSKNITESLTNILNKSSDYAGNVVEVNSQKVTKDTPYNDEYVTIDYYGNVIAKKASGSQKTYKLTTETQYTKMTTKDSGSLTFIGYEDASGNYSTTPTGVYGTQTWPVTLTVTTIGSSTSTEAPSTTEPTTAAPATYKATLSTTNAQTKIASGSQSATGNDGSIILEAGQTVTVTVTPGASTYGSTVTVSDSATTVTQISKGLYTFTMPAKAVTVTVTDITLSSISATITGAGKTASSPYAFGAKTAAPTNTEIANACKQGNPSITATLSNNTTTPVTASQATYSVKTNTLGTATGSGDTITHPGTAVITVSYGEKSTTVDYYYTYTTANQKTLQSIAIEAKTGSALSTDSTKPTVYGAKSELPSEEYIKSQIGAITATYKDSLEKISTETIDNTAAGVELKVTPTPQKETSTTVENGVHTHTYTSQVTATYNGKTSNEVTFYYQYQNYSVTCNTVDENGKTNIPSSLNATVSSTSDIEKGTTVTITSQDDTTLKYLKTNISVIGDSKKVYSLSGNTFTMPDEPVTVTVTYTKLSDYTVTKPTKTKLEAMPQKENLSSLLNGAYLTPKYQSTDGTKVDLTSNLVKVTLGADKETFENGVTTHTIPVTVAFNDIVKENAFSFIYEEKHSYTASVVKTVGPTVQFKKGSVYTNSISGYYGDTITVRVPEETQEYAFPTVTIESETGNTIETISQPGEVTFTMPAANVTVTAVYQKLTDLIVTPPDTSGAEYSKNTTKADLPLGTITAVYGSGSSKTKEIAMTTDMYTIGEKEEKTTEDDEGMTTNVIVPVTIHVEYGGIEKNVSFSYPYSYRVSKNSKPVGIETITCGTESLDNSGLVTVSQSMADLNEEIIVTVKETSKYAFPSITVRTESGREISYDKETATFIMPDEAVKINVDYKLLTDLTLKEEPFKKKYDYYTKPGDLDLTGGFLTAAYGTSGTDIKTIALGVNNGCTYTCTEGTAAEENGIQVIPVTVSITYGGKTVSYKYTYQVVRDYSVTLDETTLQEDLLNKDKIRLSKTSGHYNDELTLSLPADTGDKYAFPVVTIRRGDKVETWEPENGAYKTVITDDMIVSVSYCKLEKLELTLPTGSSDVGASLIPTDMLDTSDMKLELVYYNDKKEVGGRIPVPVREYASFAYGKETESVTNGVCTHTVPVLVTADYNGLVEAEGSYSVKYRNYVVSAKDADGNSLSVDKNRANAGDTITISLTPGLDVQKITANNTSVGYELSKDKTKAAITLDEDMLSAKTGYTFVVAYQTIQKIKAPTEAAVVSDKIMKEEELEQALADLSSFDFGTASILVSYDELEPNTEILLNSPSVAKKLLENKTTEKESADGTYIERTYVIEATVDGKSVEVPIMVKVEKKKTVTSGDASGEGTEQKNPGGNTPGTGGGNTPGTGNGNSSGDGTGKDDEKEPVVTSTKPGKVSGVKVAAKKRKLTVTWKAASNATAYEIWISTKKNGGYLKAATVNKSGSKKTYSYTVKKLDGSKLKKGKTYYVKVRAVNVKSKLTKKTINQTAKSKRNRRLYVTVKSVKNAVSYTVKASTKKKSGYKTIFKFDEIGKKKYTKYIKHQKRNTKYYIKVEVKVESGKRQEGAYTSVTKVKCK